MTALFIMTFLVGAFVGAITVAFVLIYLMGKEDDRPELTMVRAEDGELYIVYVPQK